MAGNPGDILQFINNNRISNKGPAIRNIFGNIMGNQTTQVAGMFTHHSFEQVMTQPVIDMVYTRFDGVYQSSTTHNHLNISISICEFFSSFRMISFLNSY